MNIGIELAERKLLPDALVRIGIRRLLRKRLRESSEQSERFRAGIAAAPIAANTDRANEQHYELPPRFFELVLGPRLKYSSAYYDGPGSTLAEAEERMLALTVERAEIRDGMAVLELGCG